ncbi:MAG: GGDEF domain-containing protein, partial [Beijerinckiaceae bacterium]
ENRIGEWLIVELRYERFEKGGAQYFAFTMRDLTEMRRREIELATLAFQDSLTHLNNRAAIERRLARLKDDLAEGPEASFAVMVLDLDRFKTVNDSFGHSTGDQLLVEVAARIVAAVPRNAFVGRNGGDEFVVVVGPRATYATARQIAENIVAAVAKPYPGALHAAQVGASIGVALAPADGDDVKSLLDASDAAMYRAKRTGAGVAFANEPVDRLRSVA